MVIDRFCDGAFDAAESYGDTIPNYLRSYLWCPRNSRSCTCLHTGKLPMPEWLNDGSRMNREIHLRLREGLG